MTVLPITCDNCGAKYKLPPTFTGAQAKCQKCGSVIDVAKQRAATAGGGAAAASPAAASKPAAAAKPAVDRSKQTPKEPTKPAATRPARSTRSSARAAKTADEADAGEDTPRRGGREAKKKSNTMPLLASAVGLVAIVVVVVIFLNSGEAPKTDETAQKDPPAATTPEPKPEPVAPKEPAPADPLAPGANGQTTEPPKPTEKQPAEASTPPPPPAEPEDPNRVKEPWEKMSKPPQSMDQVTDPKSYPEVTWPAGIDAAKKAELQALAEEAATDTGMRGNRAMKKLGEEGYGALFAIVERLRLLNYMTTEDSMTAFALNKTLDEITAGLSAGFVPVEANETLVPAKAEYNTRTVKGWLGLLANALLRHQDIEHAVMDIDLDVEIVADAAGDEMAARPDLLRQHFVQRPVDGAAGRRLRRHPLAGMEQDAIAQLLRRQPP